MRSENKSEILMYQTEDGSTKISVTVEQETVWLSLNDMAELFQRDKSGISRHIKNIYDEGELQEKGTIAYFATVQVVSRKFKRNSSALDEFLTVLPYEFILIQFSYIVSLRLVMTCPVPRSVGGEDTFGCVSIYGSLENRRSFKDHSPLQDNHNLRRENNCGSQSDNKECEVVKMRIILAGVSCVGKSTIGKLLAKKLGYKFFDFDFEVEERMGEHISSIKNRFFNEYGYREEVKHILRDILFAHKDDIVIAMPPGGLFHSYYAIIKKHPDVMTIALKDKAKNIVERLTFYDDETKPIYNVVNENNKHLYYEDVKKDIEYFGRTFKKAKMQFHLNGMNANDSVEALFQRLEQFKEDDR